MKLAILTGGGDVPGLNSCIKAVVNEAAENDWTVVGFRRGWGGPLNFNPDDEDSQERWLQPLTRETVRTIDRSGGTFLHTSRTQPSRVKPDGLPPFLGSLDPGDGSLIDCTPHVLRVIEHLGYANIAVVDVGQDQLSVSFGADAAIRPGTQIGLRMASSDIHLFSGDTALAALEA